MGFDLVVFDDSKPVYIQIMEFIKKQIISGELPPGHRIPSVREMAGTMKVNVNTMQRAYKELESEEVTVTKRGMGSFVTEDVNVVSILKKNMAEGIIDKFVKDMEDMGYNKDQVINLLNSRGNG
ncbi:MAG: GntR family transcriptional regulator [Clostridium sp.]